MTAKQGYGFRLSLLGIFASTWAWAAWNPLHPDDWLLENYLVFFWVPVLLITGRFFRLSDISYGLITLFMCLHVIGSHYTYAEVPFGEVLQDWTGAERNMYDRLVHFSFGLLLAYPVREVLVQIAQLRGFWAISGMRRRTCCWRAWVPLSRCSSCFLSIFGSTPIPGQSYATAYEYPKAIIHWGRQSWKSG